MDLKRTRRAPSRGVQQVHVRALGDLWAHLGSGPGENSVRGSHVCRHHGRVNSPLYDLLLNVLQAKPNAMEDAFHI